MRKIGVFLYKSESICKISPNSWRKYLHNRWLCELDLLQIRDECSQVSVFAGGCICWHRICSCITAFIAGTEIRFLRIVMSGMWSRSRIDLWLIVTMLVLRDVSGLVREDWWLCNYSKCNIIWRFIWNRKQKMYRDMMTLKSCHW